MIDANVRTIHSSRVRANRLAWIGLTNAVLIVLVCVVAFPFITMVLGSIKPQNELYSTSIKFFPSKWYPTNYEKLFGETMYVRWYLNTLFVALARTVLALFL